MTFYHLGANPHIDNQLTASLRNGFPTFDSINAPAALKIPLLEAVLKEAMRVSPVLPDLCGVEQISQWKQQDT
jgi:cytochrome P450